MTTIHQRIRSRRKQLGMTPQQLGELVGVKRQTVNAWEREVKPTLPHPDTLPKVARALEVSVAWLLAGIEQNEDRPPPPFSGVAEKSGTYITTQWPFQFVTIERLLALSDRQIGFVEGKLLAAIEECELAASEKRQVNGNP